MPKIVLYYDKLKSLKNLPNCFNIDKDKMIGLSMDGLVFAFVRKEIVKTQKAIQKRETKEWKEYVGKGGK